MSFPQLLRRSAFAQHDPLITRIYISTPSAISRTGDWGLKYPIHRPKGPKYIKVSNLDAGAAVGADWRSGEKEARFTETWGTGKVRWQRIDDSNRGLRKAPSLYEALTGEETLEEEPERLLPDLEAMTPGEFERYLDTIRSERKEFLTHRLGGVKDAAGWRKEEGDLTLINLATSGNATDACGTNMQASLVRTEIKRPQSKTLHSQPHTTGGLYYSQRIPSYTSSNLTYIDPRTTIPGRALNKKDRDQHRRDGVRANIFSSDNNTPLVVSVGGVTGSARPYQNEQSITETDYTRTHPERGVGRFQIQSARLSTLPTVINLQASEIASRYGNYPTSKAKRATPLDTFQFNIELDLANPGEELGRGMRALEPGSREWVGREPGRTPNREDALAMGGSRTGRTKGAALAGLRTAEERRSAEQEARKTQQAALGGIQSMISRRPPALRWNYLPEELLTHIASHLDSTTSLAFALTARRFRLAADSGIWPFINLTLPPDFGYDLPAVYPHAEGTRKFRTWARNVSNEAESRITVAFREKVKRIQKAGTARRFGLVRAIKICSRPGTGKGTMLILEKVSSTLQTMEIGEFGSAGEVESYLPPFERKFRDRDTLDFHLYHRCSPPTLLFPSLTSIKINNMAIRYAESVFLLCSAAPALTSLHVDLVQPLQRSPLAQRITLPPPDNPTQLRSLHLSFVATNLWDGHPLFALLRASPLLRQVSLFGVDDGESNDEYAKILVLLACLPHLDELYWNLFLDTFERARYRYEESQKRVSSGTKTGTKERNKHGFIGRDPVKEDEGVRRAIFPRLRHLTLRLWSVGDLYIFLPSLPVLEVLHLDHIHDATLPPAPCDIPPTSQPTMLCTFSSAVRGSPHLRTIILSEDLDLPLGLEIFPYLDDYEAKTPYKGVVNTYHHPSDEMPLVHARLFTKWREILDIPASEDVRYLDNGYDRAKYVGSDRSGADLVKVKVYEYQAEGAWQDLTEHDDAPVPMNVLEEMRVAEGASPAAWVGRNIEVDWDAWGELYEHLNAARRRAKMEQRKVSS